MCGQSCQAEYAYIIVQGVNFAWIGQAVDLQW